MAGSNDDAKKALAERKAELMKKMQAGGFDPTSRPLTTEERQAAQRSVKAHVDTSTDTYKKKFEFLNTYMDKNKNIDVTAEYKAVGKKQDFLERAKHFVKTRSSREEQIAVLQALMQAAIAGDVMPETFRAALTDLRNRVSNDVGKTTSRLALLIDKIELEAESAQIFNSSTKVGVVQYRAFLEGRTSRELAGNEFAREILVDLRNIPVDAMIQPATRLRADNGIFIPTPDQLNKLIRLQSDRMPKNIVGSLINVLPARAPKESKVDFDAAVLKIASLLSNVPEKNAVECCIGSLIDFKGLDSKNKLIPKIVDEVLKHLGADNLTAEEQQYCVTLSQGANVNKRASSSSDVSFNSAAMSRTSSTGSLTRPASGSSASTASMSSGDSSQASAPVAAPRRSQSPVPVPVAAKRKAIVMSPFDAFVGQLRESVATPDRIRYLRDEYKAGMEWLQAGTVPTEHKKSLENFMLPEQWEKAQSYLNDPAYVEAIRQAIIAGYEKGLQSQNAVVPALPPKPARRDGVFISQVGSVAAGVKPPVPASKPAVKPPMVYPKPSLRPPFTGGN